MPAGCPIHGDQLLRCAIEELRGFIAKTGIVAQIVPVAGLGQVRNLLLLGLAGQIIRWLRKESHEADPRIFRQGEFRDDALDRGRFGAARHRVTARDAWAAHHQFVDAKCLAVEIDPLRQAERSVQFLVEGGIEAMDIDSERSHESVHCLAEKRLGRLQGLRATVANQQMPVHREFVTLGVSTKIVMIIENQNPGSRPVSFAIEPSHCQSADTPSDNHQVIVLLDGQGTIVKDLAFSTHLVRDFVGTRVAAPQARQSRRIVARRCGAQLRKRRESRGDNDADPSRKSRRVILSVIFSSDVDCGP